MSRFFALPISRWEKGYEEFCSLPESVKSGAEEVLLKAKEELVALGDIQRLRELYLKDKEWMRVRLIHAIPNYFSDMTCNIITAAAFYLAAIEVLGDTDAKTYLGSDVQ